MASKAAATTAPFSPATLDKKIIPMSTAIATKSNDTVLAVPADQGDDALFNSIASSGKFLPRLQMFGSKSDAVASGKVPGPASYALVTGKDAFTALGDSVDCIPIAWRPKAMDVSGDDVIAVHDHAEPEFGRIQAEAEVKDSGCMFGPEFIVWLPALKRFATLFMSSKTARREAPAIRERLGKPTTLGISFIKTQKYSWHGIACKPCSTPFELPDAAALADATDAFLNPPKIEIERVEPAAATARAR